jgi:multimeric flavodoxin WrbA
MAKIIAINGSPRSGWNTDILVREAAEGARQAGAEVEVIDLYKLEKYTGCISCFGCKRESSLGRCVCRDGLFPVLEKIREADGLILGSPVYLSEISAGLRALYERLIFQYISYKKEPRSYAQRQIPVVMIFTGNAPEAFFQGPVYGKLVENYKNTLSGFIGPTKVLISADTLQVEDYTPYNWTMFDPEAKKKRREEVFPAERKEAFRLGAEMVKP